MLTEMKSPVELICEARLGPVHDATTNSEFPQIFWAGRWGGSERIESIRRLRSEILVMPDLRDIPN